MAKVFISHSWNDNDISRKIAHELKKDGAEIWIDYARIKPGEGLPDRIGEALDWCDTLVLVWSKSAAESYYVKLEWQCALDMQKKIIPCIIDSAQRPPILRGFLYIEFKNFSKGYEQLVRALDLEALKPPTPPPEPPKVVTPKRAGEKKNLIKRISFYIALVIISTVGIYLLSTIDWSNRDHPSVKPGIEQQSTQDSLKSYWEIKQSEMNTSYQHAQRRDRNTSLIASIKAQVWQEFLNNYNTDNPFNDEDDNQRAEAKTRRNHWRNIVTKDSLDAVDKANWHQRQVAMNNDYQKALHRDGQSSATAADKAKMWQDFLTQYAQNNPYSQEDNNQRNHAEKRKTDWTNYQPPKPKPPTEKTVKGMTLVFISGDTFQMGDTFGDGDDDEKPVHSVTLSDFYMSKTEVTNAQFCQFLNEKGNQTEGGVTWLDVEDEDCNITKKSGRFVPKSGYENHPVIE
jgi:hypothetical protein